MITNTAVSRTIVVSAITIILALFTAASIAAEPRLYRLNAELGDFQDVQSFAVSPDGATVVYIADQDSNNDFELYAVPIAGGSSIKLSGEIAVGGNVEGFRISPDSSRVIFHADKDTVNKEDLFSVPIEGGESTKLNSISIASSDIREYWISPDSSTVVFRDSIQEIQTFELFSVPIAGGTVTQLNESTVTGSTVIGNFRFNISPDSSTVIYQANLENNGLIMLYSVPIGGGSATRIDGNPDLEGNVISFMIRPDSEKVAYRATGVMGVNRQLFETNIDSAESIRINSSLADGGTVSGVFAYTPDSRYILYSAHEETLAVANTSLYDLELETRTKLLSSIRLSRIAPSKDSNHIIFAHGGTSNIFMPYLFYKIYSVQTADAKVSIVDLPRFSRQVHSIQITPDDRGVTYASSNALSSFSNGRNNIYHMESLGQPRIQIDVGNLFIEDMAIDRNHRYAVFRAHDFVSIENSFGFSQPKKSELYAIENFTAVSNETCFPFKAENSQNIVHCF